MSSDPMPEAAAWDGLIGELGSAAASFGSVTPAPAGAYFSLRGA
ncbi:hypothetical protein [Mycobacterium sp. 852002-50816_SCH5313054-b]|nr:hypothetical protein [Mycobacterium sp. 852002-50816_SCH5313054-b]